ncbi:MAG: hypothetical protein M3Q97_07085 [Bacteroidota bacterium]|nr:hypothetical protein [Bacteroidota bacterium]
MKITTLLFVLVFLCVTATTTAQDTTLQFLFNRSVSQLDSSLITTDILREKTPILSHLERYDGEFDTALYVTEWEISNTGRSCGIL